MDYLLLGAVLLSVLHALIPNHWFPLVVLGRANNWSLRETVGATIITGLAHILSTVLVGIAVGFLGYRLSNIYISFTEVIAPAILIMIGLVSIYLYLRQGPHEHSHGPIETQSGASKKALITSLAVALFFSPCFELEAYYLRAGGYGWLGIALVSLVYTVVTVSGMAGLVFLSFKGIRRLHWHALEHHEKLAIGLTLILLGGVTALLD